MIIDKSLQVSDKQALSGTTPIPSTDVIDLGAVDRLIGPGDPLWWVIIARTGLTGTTPTLAIAVQSDDASNFGSPTTLLTHPTLGETEFATGTRIVIPMPWQNERYLRLLYTLGGTSPTAQVDAFLTNQDPAVWKAFPDAI